MQRQFEETRGAAEGQGREPSETALGERYALNPELLEILLEIQHASYARLPVPRHQEGRCMLTGDF